MNLVFHIISSLDNGGAEGVMSRLCIYDTKYRHVVISLMDGGKYGPVLKAAGIEVFCLDFPKGGISLSGIWFLFKVLRKFKPDIVQTWMSHSDLIGGIIAKFAGVKNVFWNVRHTTLVPGKSKASTIWVAKACAFVSSWIPKRIIYCALDAKIVHERLGFKKDVSQIISNGYDLTKFYYDENLRITFRSELAMPDETNLIGMVGRYDPQKDHTNLIQALDLVKKEGYDFRLVLVGKDLDSNNHFLLSQIHHYQLIENVFLLGQRTDIPSIMNGLDLNVLSSSFGEGFPNVLAEAMACGTPCVATNVGDSAFIVGDTGWIVPVMNSQLLADKILEALQEKHLRNEQWLERKKKCRNRILTNFSLEKMISDYHKIWES